MLQIRPGTAGSWLLKEVPGSRSPQLLAGESLTAGVLQRKVIHVAVVAILVLPCRGHNPAGARHQEHQDDRQILLLEVHRGSLHSEDGRTTFEVVKSDRENPPEDAALAPWLAPRVAHNPAAIASVRDEGSSLRVLLDCVSCWPLSLERMCE